MIKYKNYFLILFEYRLIFFTLFAGKKCKSNHFLLFFFSSLKDYMEKLKPFYVYNAK